MLLCAENGQWLTDICSSNTSFISSTGSRRVKWNSFTCQANASILAITNVRVHSTIYPNIGDRYLPAYIMLAKLLEYWTAVMILSERSPIILMHLHGPSNLGYIYYILTTALLHIATLPPSLLSGSDDCSSDCIQCMHAWWIYVTVHEKTMHNSLDINLRYRPK